MNEMKIDRNALLEIFEYSGSEQNAFFDKATGEILLWNECYSESDEKEEIYRRLDENPSRYIEIEGPDSREQWSWMAGFTESVGDNHLKELLQVSLEGKGSFSRYRNVLDRYPEQYQLWEKFRQQKLNQALDEWITVHLTETEES